MADENKPTPKNKIQDKFEELKKHEKVEDCRNYVKEHKADTIAYIILFIGIIISLFSPLYGGAVVGAVVGIYFADDIVNTLGNLKNFVEKKGILKSLMLLGLLIAFFIALPALFIAGAAAVGIKQLIYPKKKG